MLFTTLKRTIHAGFVSFWRNGWLSMATIMVMALTLFVMGSLLLVNALMNSVITSLEQKIDITVYFTPGASDDQMLAVKQDVEKLPDVKAVAFVSRDAALAVFQEAHKDNALIASALQEVGENPLEASINIRATDPTHYAAISDFLTSKKYPIVEKINYFENQTVIDRLSSILASVRGGGALIALFLAFVAVLVAFNTIRIAIFTMREEISIMRLVGATSWFVRGPFLVNGLLYGVVAAVATMLAFLPITWLIAPKLAFLVPSFDLYHYFTANFLQFFGLLAAFGVILGSLSSVFAVRRYLKV